ncbi:hypothetical protein [Catelliglobosispora koreensis]|uniref:hypothetical protein n=1 Tax=Catelliglobosispora koreensis TaxID=129052 RepID=UPI00037E61B4|nr:hypothetical protein [Catelliglobosispora koreensis]
MDLWDVAKVMWRRRWVAVPLLLLAMVAAVFALLTVPPDYNIKGQLAVTSPTVVNNDAKGTTPVNPFSPNTLAEYTVIRGNGAEVHNMLKAEGLSPEFELTAKTFGLTVIEINVLAKSEASARATLDRLIQLIQSEFEQRQSGFNLPKGGTIQTEVLDPGEKVEVVRTVGKRTLIVIVGVGILVTVAVSLWVDALVRRRYLRVPESPEARAVVPVSPAIIMPPPPVSYAGPNAANAETVSLADDRDDNDSTVVLPLAGVSWSGGPKNKRNTGNNGKK